MSNPRPRYEFLGDDFVVYDLKPTHKHDCDSCVFVGKVFAGWTSTLLADLWVHGTFGKPAFSLIYRESSEGSNYTTAPLGADASALARFPWALEVLTRMAHGYVGLDGRANPKPMREVRSLAELPWDGVSFSEVQAAIDWEHFLAAED